MIPKLSSGSTIYTSITQLHFVKINHRHLHKQKWRREHFCYFFEFSFFLTTAGRRIICFRGLLLEYVLFYPS
jgi:hypothetical protein